MNYQGNNPEGYPDPTANQAVGIVSREEKEAAKAKNYQLITQYKLTKYDKEGAEMSKIEKAVQQMEAWAGDDSHGYDQTYRWGQHGDLQA